MKWLVLIFLIPSLCFGQSVSQLDEKDGYKDIKFAMSADSVIIKAGGKLIKGIKDEHVQYFEAKNKEYLKFGDFGVELIIAKSIKLDSIAFYYFTFNNGGIDNYRNAWRFFKSLFGEPTKKNESNTFLEWNGYKVKLTLEYSYSNESIKAVMYNINVAEQIENSEVQKTRKTDF